MCYAAALVFEREDYRPGKELLSPLVEDAHPLQQTALGRVVDGQQFFAVAVTSLKCAQQAFEPGP